MKFFFFLIAQKHELSQEETKLGTNNKKKPSEEVSVNIVSFQLAVMSYVEL